MPNSCSKNKSNVYPLILVILIALGFAYRFDFLYHSNFVIDSDEAIVGLMAKHMNEGSAFPTFYYGQHYMGSFEPMVASLFFKLFGQNSLILKLVPLVFALILIPIVYLLATESFNKRAGLIAAGYIALAPVPMNVWSTMTRGGFIETVLLCTIALLVCQRWLKELPNSSGRIYLLGLICGFGWWTNNQIIYVMSVCALAVLGRCLHTKEPFKLIFLNLFRGMLGFFVGGLPFWIYNIQNNFASFGIFSFTDKFFQQLTGTLCIAYPILLGAKKFWETADLYNDSTFIVVSTYLILFTYFLYRRGANTLRIITLKFDTNSGPELALLMVFFSTMIFALSSYGYLVEAPRYLLPVYVPIAIIFACTIEYLIQSKTKILASTLCLIILIFNLLSAFPNGRATPGMPYVYAHERVAKNHDQLINLLNERKISWIRTNYWIGYRLAFETNEKIKFLSFGLPQHTRIKQYQLDFVNTKLVEEQLPIVTVPTEAKIVTNAFKALNYQYRKTRVGEYFLIDQIVTPNNNLILLDSTKYQLSASHNSELIKYINDHNVETRWGSGAPQNKTMAIAIDFKEIQQISSIAYNLGTFLHDYPRNLEIMGFTAAGERIRLLKRVNYRAVRYYLMDSHYFVFSWTPVKLKRILIKQLGNDAIFDWSVAELELYQ